MSSFLRRFLADESAATSIEYGLIAVVVSVGILASVQAFSGSLANLWNYTATNITANLP
ncbi:MAG TPA: Flp family type IVb pilin [Myxococcota bacterium]|nr:Flp family type IVb pilin [Myxococcota bacterium]